MQRHLVGEQVEIGDDRELYLDGLTSGDHRGSPDRHGRVHGDPAILDQPPRLRARQFWQLRRHQPVQAAFLLRGEVVARRGHRSIPGSPAPRSCARSSRKESRTSASTPITIAESAMLNAG